jgi:hypothetical protein
MMMADKIEALKSSEVRSFATLDRGVFLLRPDEPVPPGAVPMTQGEYQAALHLEKWGFDDPQGRFTKDDPIGIDEFIRRRDASAQVPVPRRSR